MGKGTSLRDAVRASPVHVLVLGCLGLFTVAGVLVLLLTHSYPLGDQPFPDAHEYLNAAYRLAHGLGYSTTVRDNPYSTHVHQAVNPPRFPPGTSLILAPFALVGSYPGNVEFAARLIVIALVVATGWAGYTIGGWYPALISACVVAFSPFATVNARMVMSDALGALLAVVCLPLMKVGSRWSGYILGVVAGYGVVCRESGILLLVCVLVVCGGAQRLRVAAGAVLPLLGLALYNLFTFGAPWSSGYGYWLGGFPEYSLSYVTKHPWPPGGEAGYYQSSLELFHLVGHLHGGVLGSLPNLVFYPLILLGFSTVYGPPLLTLVGLVTAIWSWSRPEARLTLLLAGSSVLFFMANYTQDPRFLAGPCILLTIWGAVGLVRIARALWDRYEPDFRPRASTLTPTG